MDNAEKVQKNRTKQAFWKGFRLCAVLVVGVFCLYQCRLYWLVRNIHRTQPTRQDVGTLSALLSMPPDSSFEIIQFELSYLYGMGDATGNWAAAVRRNSKSPTWQQMLVNWRPVKDPIFGGAVSKSCTLSWVKDLIDNYEPQDAIYEASHKYRRLVSVHRSYAETETNVRVLNWPYDCEAFFLPNDPDTLYLCGDGVMLLDDSVIDFESTTTTSTWVSQ